MLSYACPTCGRVNPTRTCPEHIARATRSPSSRRTGTRQWRTIRAKVLRRDDHTCQLCGNHATQVDHITPVSSGGSDKPTNLRAVCGPCNQARNRAANHPAGHVALVIGPPASGKSRLALALKRQLGWDYLNIDDYRARGLGTAWDQVAHHLDTQPGPIVLEGCNPPLGIHSRLDQRGSTTVRTTAPDEVIARRLSDRGWRPRHISRVLAETYDDSATFTVDTSTSTTLDVELIAAHLAAVEDSLTVNPAGNKGNQCTETDQVHTPPPGEA